VAREEVKAKQRNQNEWSKGVTALKWKIKEKIP